MKENMNLGISRSCSSTPSHEVKKIGHLLVLVGLLSIFGSLYGHPSCLGLGPIPEPCDLCPELVWSRAHKRSEALDLHAEA